MEEVFRVQIIKSSKPSFWYRNKIGKIYDVIYVPKQGETPAYWGVIKNEEMKDITVGLRITLEDAIDVMRRDKIINIKNRIDDKRT